MSHLGHKRRSRRARPRVRSTVDSADVTMALVLFRQGANSRQPLIFADLGVPFYISPRAVAGFWLAIGAVPCQND